MKIFGMPRCASGRWRRRCGAVDVLGNMALENEAAILNRWPISHEPLVAIAILLL